MIGSAIAGGFVGTLVMTAMMRGASEMGLTRIDFALLLGTTVSDNRTKARAVGYVFHVVLGIGFALAYAEFFAIVGRSIRNGIVSPSTVASSSASIVALFSWCSRVRLPR